MPRNLGSMGFERRLERRGRNTWDGHFLIVAPEGNPRRGQIRVGKVEKQGATGHQAGYPLGQGQFLPRRARVRGRRQLQQRLTEPASIDLACARWPSRPRYAEQPGQRRSGSSVSNHACNICPLGASTRPLQRQQIQRRAVVPSPTPRRADAARVQLRNVGRVGRGAGRLYPTGDRQYVRRCPARRGALRLRLGQAGRLRLRCAFLWTTAWLTYVAMLLM